MIEDQVQADDTIRLTSKQRKMVVEADADFERGEKGYTAEQLIEHARAKVRAWTQTSSQSA